MTPLDHTFKALADPTRRAIIARLAQGDAYVGEIAEPFAMSWPAVTKHLKVLERAGLIEQRREGNNRRCRLRPAAINDAKHWMEEVETFWQQQLDSLKRYFEETNRQDADDKDER